MNKIPDLLGWNIYPGWYSGGARRITAAMLDSRRDTSRHGGFCVSEYGAGANPAQHEQNPKQPKPAGQWHPEEWQAEVHEAAWAAMKAAAVRLGHASSGACLISPSARGTKAASPGLNDKGLVTYDRKTKKDAFYFYKANWSDEPVLYITSRRFTERTNAVTDMKIYSNANEVELLLNGVSLGTMNNATNCVFVWKNAVMKSGENQVEAKAAPRGKGLTDNCVWTLKPAP